MNKARSDFQRSDDFQYAEDSPVKIPEDLRDEFEGEFLCECGSEILNWKGCLRSDKRIVVMGRCHTCHDVGSISYSRETGKVISTGAYDSIEQ